jgi:hypothetical protein
VEEEEELPCLLETLQRETSGGINYQPPPTQIPRIMMTPPSRDGGDYGDAVGYYERRRVARLLLADGGGGDMIRRPTNPEESSNFNPLARLGLIISIGQLSPIQAIVFSLCK